MVHKTVWRENTRNMAVFQFVMSVTDLTPNRPHVIEFTIKKDVLISFLHLNYCDLERFILFRIVLIGHEKECIICQREQKRYGTKYSRMDHVKFVKDSL